MLARLARRSRAASSAARRPGACVRFLRLGEVVPDFKAETTEGDISFHEWIGDKYALLVSHPADFTPACTTELAALVNLLPEFEKRNVRPIGLSCDRLAKHKKWARDVVEYSGGSKDTPLPYPIIADADRAVAGLYDMIQEADLKDPEDGLPLTVRSVFLIDQDRRLRLNLTYPSSTGRSWVEVLRAIDSIQLSDKHPVATPEGWTPGDDVVVVPSMTTKEAQAKFPDVKVVYPYLRIVKDPSK